MIYCPLLLHLHNESLTEKKRVEEVLFAQHLLTTVQREQFDTMYACFLSSNISIFVSACRSYLSCEIIKTSKSEQKCIHFAA